VKAQEKDQKGKNWVCFKDVSPHISRLIHRFSQVIHKYAGIEFVYQQSIRNGPD
jgi:hypothetical protein